jgi:hypothetical protein
MTAIHTRAMLVALHVSTWTARRYDRKITSETNARMNASADAGRYNKMLLPGDCATFKTALQAASSARAAHYSNTLPWKDDGWRLLPTANWTAYTDTMRAQRSTFDAAVSAFHLDYPRLRNNAPALLGTAYDDRDYPSSATIRSKFGFQLDFSPLPSFGDVRVDLPEEQIRQIETEMQQRVESSIGDAMRDAWQRLYSVVAAARDRLSDPTAIFRDTLIGNVREVCDVLGRLNVTGDPDLSTLRADVLSELGQYDAQALRDDDVLRAQTARKADALISAMTAYYTPPAADAAEDQ